MSSKTRPAERATKLRWLAFAAALAAAVMDLLDSTIAQVAAPSIRRDLGGSYTVIEWVTAGYTLAMAAGLLTGGRLGDLYGRKRMLLVGIAGFVATSIACAVAGTPEELIAARALQGFTGAVMLPQVFGLMRDLFAPEEMGKAFGIFGPVMGLSAMLGPIVSGGLIHADVLSLGWRAIFLVNAPIGIASLVIGARSIPDVAPESRDSGLDLAGMVLAGTGMFLLVFPLVQGRDLGWPVWLAAMLVCSVPVLIAFAIHQLRRKSSGRSPLIEPSIFRHRAYAAGLLFDIVFIGSMAGIILIFNVMLQAGLGFSAWHSALTTAPWALGAFFGSGIAAATMPRFGRKVLHAGLAVESVGLLAVFLVLHSAGTGVGSVQLLVPMLAGGAGMGMVFVPLFDIVMAGVQPHEIGSASGVLKTVDGLGMSIGIAGLGAIFFSIVGHGDAHAFLTAGEWTALASVALLAVAFAVAFMLPSHAREPQVEQPGEPAAAAA